MPPERNLTLDLGRIVAAFGVVSLHVPSETFSAKLINFVFWPTSVPFFYCASLLFFIIHMQRTGAASPVPNQIRRMVIPFLFWTGLYVGLLLAKAWLTGGDRTFDWIGVFLYGESALHLYFIPTLLLYQTLTYSAFLFADRKWIGAMGTFLLSVAYIGYGDYTDRFGVSATGQIVAIPVFLLGCWLISKFLKGGYLSLRWGLSGLVLWLAVVTLNYFGERFHILDYPMIFPIGGISFLMMALSFRVPKSWTWVLPLAGASYGVYLSHVIILEMIEFGWEKHILPEVPMNFIGKLTVVSIIFCSSTGLVFTIRKARFLRMVALGER